MAKRWKGENFIELRYQYFDKVISNMDEGEIKRVKKGDLERARHETIMRKLREAKRQRRANLRQTSTAEDLLKLFET